MRFYLKHIRPNLEKIKQGKFVFQSLPSIPGWATIMGLQFENMVLHNRPAVWEKLRLRAEDIVSDNPYYQTKTNIHPGCQIDYLIHAKYNTLYLCEIKFSGELIGRQVISDVEKKMRALSTPKNFTIRPVLIHEGPLAPQIAESGFFDRGINFADLLR